MHHLSLASLANTRILVRSSSAEYHRRKKIGDHSRETIFLFPSSFHPSFSIEAENRGNVVYTVIRTLGKSGRFFFF